MKIWKLKKTIEISIFFENLEIKKNRNLEFYLKISKLKQKTSKFRIFLENLEIKKNYRNFDFFLKILKLKKNRNLEFYLKISKSGCQYCILDLKFVQKFKVRTLLKNLPIYIWPKLMSLK